jgi:hypothetical protein
MSSLTTGFGRQALVLKMNCPYFMISRYRGWVTELQYIQLSTVKNG